MKQLLHSMWKGVLGNGPLRALVDSIVANSFHSLLHHSPDTHLQNRFLGYPVREWPFDLQLYQELIYRIRPSFGQELLTAGPFSTSQLSLISLKEVPRPLSWGLT